LAVPASTDAEHAYLLAEVERIDLAGPLPQRLWCHARVRNARARAPAQWEADVTLRSLDGGVLGVVRGVRLRRASRDSLSRALGGDLFYKVDWQHAPVATPAAAQLRPPDAFVPRIRQRFGELAESHDLSVYDRLLPELDRLSGDYVADGLRGLGFDDTPGRSFDIASEAQRLGVERTPK